MIFVYATKLNFVIFFVKFAHKNLTLYVKVYNLSWCGFSGCSSVGRVLVLGTSGRRFESCHPELHLVCISIGPVAQLDRATAF